MKITPKKIGLGMALLTGSLIALSGASLSHVLVLMPVMFVISNVVSGAALQPNGLLSHGELEHQLIHDDPDGSEFSNSCNPLLIDSLNYNHEWIDH